MRFPADESRISWTMDWAVLRFSVDTQMADWMIWAGVGLGGTCLELTSEVSQVSGYRVAVHAWWISGGMESRLGLGLLNFGGDGEEWWWRAAEEREKKRRRESKARKRKEAMERRRNLEVKGCLSFLGFLWYIFICVWEWNIYIYTNVKILIWRIELGIHGIDGGCRCC